MHASRSSVEVESTDRLNTGDEARFVHLLEEVAWRLQPTPSLPTISVRTARLHAEQRVREREGETTGTVVLLQYVLCDTP